MSEAKNRYEAERWLATALKDIEAAQVLRREGIYSLACFHAQQAAEKAVKALHLYLGQDAWGHVVARLLEALPAEAAVPGELIEAARVLDNYYIPSRYPNSHPEGAPFEHYGPLQSDGALEHARQIVEFARSKMAEGH